VLKKPEYFGQYGTILKIVVNTANGYKSNEGKEHTYSAYLTYSKPSEASIAILAVDGKVINNNCLRTTYGSTKFCAFYLKGKECTNKECLYLHTEANDYDEILERDDINNKINFRQQQLQAIKIGNIFNFEIRKKILASEKIINAVLPGVSTIYENQIVYDNDLNHVEFSKYLVKEKETSSTNNTNNSNTNNAVTKNSNNNVIEEKLEKLEKQHTSFNSFNSKTKSIESNENEKEYKDYKEFHKSNKKTKDDELLSINSDSCDGFEKVKRLTELNENNLKSSMSTTTESVEYNKDTNIKLFKSKTFSRFSFVEEDNSKKNIELGVEVPRFVSQIINNNMNKSNNKFAKMLQEHIIQNISEEYKTEKNNTDIIDNIDKSNNSTYNWANYLLEL